MSAPYDNYARVYDAIGQPRYSLSMVSLIVAELERLRVTGGRLLDLACGTGSAAMEFARRGFEVTGVDFSPAMLREARQKAASTARTVEFFEQDMSRLSLQREFDVAICLYDSVNYLLALEVVADMVEATRRVLRPGGALIFDFNTPRAYERFDGRDTVAVDSEQLFGVYHHSYDPLRRRNEVRMTFFERKGVSYQRWEERHLQSAYESEEVRHVVDAAGLALARAWPLPENVEPALARRWAFVCLNPA